MEISSGSQCNCSELVTRLYPAPSSDEELHEWLEDIEGATGLKIGVEVRGEITPDFDSEEKNVEWALLGRSGERKRVFKPVDIERARIVDRKVSKEEYRVPVDELGDFEDFYRDHSYGDNSTTRIVLSKFNDLTIRDPYDGFEGLTVCHHDGYCSKGIQVKALGDYYDQHFGPLSKLCRELDGTFHTHDGGSSAPFIKWLKNKGYNKIVEKEEY